MNLPRGPNIGGGCRWLGCNIPAAENGQGSFFANVGFSLRHKKVFISHSDGRILSVSVSTFKTHELYISRSTPKYSI